MALSGLQNERMPDRWDNIGGKISTETQNKTALTEGTSIKTERKWPHGWTKHMIWSYTSYPPITHTHTHTSINTHTSTHSSWWEGRLSDMATVRKVNLGRWACPMPWLILGFPHPLMQGSGLCPQHNYIRNGSQRAVLSTPSHMIESHPHPHIHILYNYCFSIYFVSFQF